MRLIHRLAQDPRRYLETMPVVIPRMGENPHGLYHFMHGDWRIWAPLLMRLAALVNNRQVKWDPTMVDFSSHEHFLRIVSQACAEYVVEIARTGTDFRATQHFLADAERNLSFAYIVFFLYLFAFKYLEYKNAIRRNASQHLDMLWRENLSSTRTAKANKTNYRQMSIILVYWGAALVPPLQAFYHNTRTIRWIHAHVGWDMPIEKLNAHGSRSRWCLTSQSSKSSNSFGASTLCSLSSEPSSRSFPGGVRVTQQHQRILRPMCYSSRNFCGSTSAPPMPQPLSHRMQICWVLICQIGVGCVGRVRVRHSTSCVGQPAGIVSTYAGSWQNCAHGTTGHSDIS